MQTQESKLTLSVLALAPEAAVEVVLDVAATPLVVFSLSSGFTVAGGPAEASGFAVAVEEVD